MKRKFLMMYMLFALFTMTRYGVWVNAAVETTQASTEITTTATKTETTTTATKTETTTTATKTETSTTATKTETSTTATKTTIATTATKTETTETVPVSTWLNTCKSIAKTMEAKHFVYSNSNLRGNFSEAVSKWRKGNCSRYVSWCLQKYGIIPKGSHFYARNNGSIKTSFKSWGSKVSIIRVMKKSKDVSLKPGDIVCWVGMHVNVYYGKNSSGQKLWYDAGTVTTKAKRKGSRYTTLSKAQHLKGLENRKISYIIRIKNLK